MDETGVSDTIRLLALSKSGRKRLVSAFIRNSEWTPIVPACSTLRISSAGHHGYLDPSEAGSTTEFIRSVGRAEALGFAPANAKRIGMRIASRSHSSCARSQSIVLVPCGQIERLKHWLILMQPEAIDNTSRICKIGRRRSSIFIRWLWDSTA